VTARRPYHSPARRRQADDTRQRIVAVARTLMLARGYPATTWEQIGAEAGVAPQTVRAAYGTKANLLAAVITKAIYDHTYDDLVQDAGATTTAAQHLAAAAAITCHLYSALDAELTLLHDAAGSTPALHELARQVADRRRQRQAPLIAHLVAGGELRSELDATTAADIVWALTGHDLYRMLVRERKWTPQRFRSWLTEQLTRSLLGT
jgi:AcrR family transcriptional regulator